MADSTTTPKRSLADKELDLYRNILVPPTEFKSGFGWSTVLGIVFCGLVMLPGSIYLGLMNGGRLGPAAAWVTVILFNEIARRSLKTMQKQHLVILLHAASVVMAANVLFPGGPCAQLVFRAYLSTSEVIRDSGMQEFIPNWWVPDADSPAITERSLWHSDWLMPLGLVAFSVFIGLLRRYTLGYFFFRLTSDVENLPFPMASVGAQGAMAMAEADDAGTKDGEDPGKAFFDKKHQKTGKKKSERWRFFSLGAVMGIAFGMIQVGIPAVTKVLLGKPFFLIPLPWIDTTVMTQGLLPATPTGIALDLGIILLGMVLPFWAVMGTCFAVLLKIVMNPILYHNGVLTNWQEGQDTINTTFSNEVDFWMSFMMGASLGLLVVSVFQSIRDVRKKMKSIRLERKDNTKRVSPWTPPPGRGDYPMWIAGVIYTGTSVLMVGMCYLLLSDVDPKFMPPGVLLSLLVFMSVYTMVYNPLISYLNARLLGIAGQVINVPYVRETAFVLSGARGIDIWLMPIPWANYGHQAQAFRTVELTGTRFWSMAKTELVAIPLLFVLSFSFWAFIWKGNEIPSASFPYAQRVWEIQAKRTALQWSATYSPDGKEVDFWETEFGKAIKPRYVAAGFFTTTGIFIIVAAIGLPAMFCYGMIKGFGQFPHVLILEIIGALIARFILRKKYGSQRVLRIMPTIVAGYFTGVGLIAMATIALDLIVKAVSAAPF